jgi:hypothetical protein
MRITASWSGQTHAVLTDAIRGGKHVIRLDRTVPPERDP